MLDNYCNVYGAQFIIYYPTNINLAVYPTNSHKPKTRRRRSLDVNVYELRI
jgi:hypothetical protein